MILPSLTLPGGRRGQALAIALTIIAAALLWLCTAAPLIGYYEVRADRLVQQEQLAARMKALSQEITVLRQTVSAAGLQSGSDQILLAGGTDVIAGANLQSALQDLATQAGTSLDSAALLSAQPAGTLRRIGMQVSITATWPVLIALLEAIGTARPYMILDQISLTSVLPTGPGQEPLLQAYFSVTAFRAGSP
jgi:general secretion pathway protein M